MFFEVIVIKTISKFPNSGVTDILNLSLTKSQNLEFESSNSYKIIFCIDGCARIVIGEDVFSVSASDISIIKPDEIYCVFENKNAALLTVTLNCNNELAKEITSGVFSTTQAEQLLFEELSLLTESLSDDIIYRQIKATAELILLRSINKQAVSPDSNDNNAKVLKNAIKILQKNVATQLSTNELADKLDISVSSLKRLFTKYLKLGAHEYFLYLKIAAAKKYLLEGYSVTEIAEKLQFANQAYFSTTFKRVTGISPKELSAHKPKTAQPTRKSKTSKNDMPSYLL